MSGSLTPNVIAVLIGVFAALAVGSVIRLVTLRGETTDEAGTRRASLATWWMLAILVSMAVSVGAMGVCLLLGAASWMSFSEYRRLEARDEADRFAFGLLQLTIPGVYGAVFLGWGRIALALLPIVAVLVVATAELRFEVTRGYVRSIGAQVFGTVVLVGGLAHGAQMVAGAGLGNPVGGASGWFVFVVLLTEANDIAQALVGRWIGSHPVTVVSPHKTWEGVFGGAVTTVILAFPLALLLTPLAASSPNFMSGEAVAWTLVAGVIVSMSGLLGDLNMSAVKRDAGVKDSSHVLPGMGGVLDRVDSLTLTAPVLYWAVVVPTAS